VFQTILQQFEATKTCGGVNVMIKTVIFVDENLKQDEGNALREYVGPRPTGNHKNKFKMADT